MDLNAIMDNAFEEWDWMDCHIFNGVLTVLGDKVNVEDWEENEIEEYVRDAIVIFKQNKEDE